MTVCAGAHESGKCHEGATSGCGAAKPKPERGGAVTRYVPADLVVGRWYELSVKDDGYEHRVLGVYDGEQNGDHLFTLMLNDRDRDGFRASAVVLFVPSEEIEALMAARRDPSSPASFPDQAGWQRPPTPVSPEPVDGPIPTRNMTGSTECDHSRSAAHRCEVASGPEALMALHRRVDGRSPQDRRGVVEG